MGRLNIMIGDELEKKLRKYLAKDGTFRKGDISKYIEIAIFEKLKRGKNDKQN